MRMVLTVLFLGHGVAHVVGFVVPWKLITSVEVPYRTTVLGGVLDLGPVGVRIVGLFWLIVSMAFVSVAVALQQHTSWWYREAFILCGISLVLCSLSWPESRPGVVANAVVLTMLIAGGLLGWYPEASLAR